MVPEWLLSCSAIVIADITRDPQHMWIMDRAWPTICLLIGVVSYSTTASLTSKSLVMPAIRRGDEQPDKTQTTSILVASGANHCGANCRLGGSSRWLAFAAPVVVVVLGWAGLEEHQGEDAGSRYPVPADAGA